MGGGALNERWLALALAIVTVATLPAALRSRRARHVIVALCPAAAVLLSAAYVELYLRGGPRIIDATSYWLQAKALSLGMLTIPLPEPEHALLGRFLLRSREGAAVIFPPGYAAVLSLGFRIGAPLAIGPALAGGLVLATISLARRATRLLSMSAKTRDQLVTVAAILSASCAALRYHTADTMSHGLAALLMCVALSAALSTSRWRFVLLGLCVGALFATRPASAIALFGVLLLTLRRDEAVIATGLALLGAVPGLTLWAVYQNAATGDVLEPAQLAYYALSDGPPGCFRYGFGDQIGCLGEHGDFVRANLSDGYGLVAALKTTGRRLMKHVWDAMGFAPCFGLVAIGGAVLRRHVGLLPLAIIAVYAPFYFDGNYPGGGGRMFADAIAVEHVLAVVGIGWLVGRFTSPASRRRRIERLMDVALLGALAVSLSFLGFAIHLAAEHRSLRDRDGGHPMFPPSGRAGVTYVDTDHGFNLGAAWALGRDDATVVRRKGDDLDLLSAKTPSFRVERLAGGARLVPWSPRPRAPDRFTIEGESLWPPRAISGGYAWPSHVATPCVSRGRGLALYPSGATSVRVELALPVGQGRMVMSVTRLSDRDTKVFSMVYGDETRSEVIIRSDGCNTLIEHALPPRTTERRLIIAAPHPVLIDVFDVWEKR